MAKIYYRAVVAGRRTLESVPARWRDEVRRMLDEDSATVAEDEGQANDRQP